MVLAVGAAVAVMAGCSAQAPVAGASPSVPAGLDAVPITPLPAERNGIEEMPSATAEAAILAAIEAQTSVEIAGALERSATQEDGSVVRTPLTFAFSGAERAYSATVTWSGATVALSRHGDELWMEADAAAAQALERPDATGVCLPADDPLRAQWDWLDGPQAVIEALLADAALGGGDVDDSEQVATFQVVAGGAVVGTIEASAVGQPVPLRLELEDASGTASVEFIAWSATLEPAATGCDDVDTD